MKVRINLGGLIDEVNVSVGPRGSEPHDLRRTSIKVALIGQESVLLAIKRAGQIGPVNPEGFFGGIDFHLRIHVQEVSHSSHVITVPM